MEPLSQPTSLGFPGSFSTSVSSLFWGIPWGQSNLSCLSMPARRHSSSPTSDWMKATAVEVGRQFQGCFTQDVGELEAPLAVPGKQTSWWREVKVVQLCLTLCDPIHCCPPGSSVHEILQARVLEWVSISFSNHESEKWKWRPGFEPGLLPWRQILYHVSLQGSPETRVTQ